MAINFASSKDTNETRIVHSKSNKKEIMIRNEKNEIIQELFVSLLQNIKKPLRELIKESEYFSDSINNNNNDD